MTERDGESQANPDPKGTDAGTSSTPAAAAFAALARTRPKSTLAELGAYVRETRAYWLAPILVTLVVFAALLALSATSAAPFVYTLF